MSIYSQTLEKRSSAPPKPPAGLGGLLEVGVGPAETGAALAHPPKSSSAVTVGAGLGSGAPQPPPMSAAVKVSGTFIIEDGAAGAGAGAREGAGAGAGSGVLQALPPHGSMPPDMAFAAAAVAAGTWGLGGEVCKGGLDRLKAELIPCCGDDTVGFGGAAGGEERPKRSLERDDDGGLGFEGWGGGEANPPNPKSCEFEEIEVVRD